MTKLESVFEGLKAEGKITKEQQLSRGMKLVEAIEDNWKYSFFFDNGRLSKVEAYNGREFIEAWNK